jgi:hypothetical protein
MQRRNDRFDHGDLIPVQAVRQGVTAFKAKRDAMFESSKDQLRSCTANIVNELNALNLPAAIEALESPVTVPKVSR